MKFSYNLLKQFVPISLPPEKLAAVLTEHAFEVEDVTKTGGGFEKIVAAKVLSVEKHPNADRLRVVKLEVAGSKIVDPVVCGAFNFGPGDVVALALPGAIISQNIHSDKHESFILEKAKIRGVESQGMICAEFELGLSDAPGDKPEIMVLDKSTKPGTPLSEIVNSGTSDYVLNIALPANRPDLHSHLGVAREIASVLNVKLKTNDYKLKTLPKPSKTWKVIVKNKTLCPRYFGVKMKVKVGPSPKFIAETLTAVGMRPINNVVDITNFVMMELGQPTHAFDAGKVEGNIIVKIAQKGEKFLALNHKQYELDDTMLIICDEKKPLALGAIIGGKESEVAESTSEIILEVANFNGIGIRKTCKKLGIRTEGSAMWEKGIHPKLAELGLARAIELLQKYADAEILGFAKFETAIKKPSAIKFNTQEVNKLLGTKLSAAQIKNYLKRYGVLVKDKGLKIKDTTAAPPWWRTDLATMPDLAEEVLKLHGYNNIKPLPLNITAPVGAGFSRPSSDSGRASPAPTTQDIYQAKNLFSRLGYSEVQNYNFVSEKDILKVGGNTKDHVEIQNPLSEDQRYLKKFPISHILKNTNLNQKNFGHFKLFEITKQYFGFENEPVILVAINFSKNTPTEKLLMSQKEDVLEFFKTLGHRQIEFGKISGGSWIDITCRGQILGGLGLVQEPLLKNFDIDGNIALIKLELEKLLAIKKDILYQPINKLPKVERDISVIIDSKTLWQDIHHVVSPFMGSFDDLKINYTAAMSLFEAPFLTHDKDSQKFHQDLAKQGKKNYGIHLIFEPKNHTLTDAEITGILDKIVLELQKKLHAEVR